MRWIEDNEIEAWRELEPDELGEGKFHSLYDLVKHAVKTKPSFPNLVDEYEPTDPKLWELMLEVASGKRLKYQRGDREVNSPNGTRGYRNMPHNPKGIAWAVKQYKGFGGNFKKEAGKVVFFNKSLSAVQQDIRALQKNVKAIDDVLNSLTPLIGCLQSKELAQAYDQMNGFKAAHPSMLEFCKKGLDSLKRLDHELGQALALGEINGVEKVSQEYAELMKTYRDIPTLYESYYDDKVTFDSDELSNIPGKQGKALAKAWENVDPMDGHPSWPEDNWDSPAGIKSLARSKGVKTAKDKIPGGLADKGEPKDLDPKQLEKGIKIEMEHTDDKSVAREIALDHLTEDPKYYSKLETIEKHGRVCAIVGSAKYAKLDVTAASKYDHINFKPPESVANAAKKGLEYRKQQGDDKAGLTPSEASKEGIGSGVQRATNLKNRDTISPQVINQMVAFFSRHEKNKSVAPEHKDEPWKDKGHVSWLLWGGDPGKAWAEKVQKQMETADGTTDKSAAWARRFASMAYGGVEITEGTATQEAMFLEDAGVIVLAHERDGRHYWDITAEGERLFVAGLKEDLLKKVEDLKGRSHKYEEGQYASEEDKKALRDFAQWFRQNFRVDSSKTPRGMRDVKDSAQSLLRALELYGEPYGNLRPGAMDFSNSSTWLWLSDHLDELVQNFSAEGDKSKGKKEVVTEVKGSHAVYFNRGNISGENFKKYVARMEQIFGSLQGFHKKALAGTLKVAFVGAQQMKVQGKYRESTDELWVKATPQVMARGSGGYGSPEYIIVHELGHRYEKYNRPSIDFDREDWRTTRYSMNDGESFAELFALSHFDLKGPWDQDRVEKFKRVMSGKEKAASGVSTPKVSLDWED